MNYCVRETLPGDKLFVLQIHKNVYEGLDYLPDYFDYFQSSEHVTSYLCTEKDKVIAYVSCCHVDSGETVVTRAGRVSPEYQGQQVYQFLRKEVEERESKHGKLRYLVLTKGDQPSESFLQSYKPVAAKGIHLFEYQRSQMADKLMLLEDISTGNGMKVDNIHVDFLSPPYRNYLFPEGRIILDWVPYRFLLTNIPLFKGNGTTFFSDLSLKTTEAGQETVQGLLSASTIFKAHHDLDLGCNLDIFGNDFHSLGEHLKFHLGLIHENGLENINLRIYTSKGSKTYELDELMGSLGVQRMTSGKRKEHYVELVAYEKTIF